jgi:hypothetical protein
MIALGRVHVQRDPLDLGGGRGLTPLGGAIRRRRRRDRPSRFFDVDGLARGGARRVRLGIYLC